MTIRSATPLLAALLCATGAGAVRAHALDSLVATERAFARTSAERGARAAFLEYLAGDGLIFRPLPTPGRPVWEARGPIAASLLWEPAYAEVSAAGDLGWTTGPWELRPEDPKRATGYGHFVSVWRKPPGGPWRVAVDAGIAHPRPGHGLGDVELARGPVHAAPARGGAGDLEAQDRDWSREAAARGAVTAFRRRAAKDVRLYRDGTWPVLGAAAATEVLRTVPGTVAWRPLGQAVAASGDLGCTYGVLERRERPDAVPDSSAYLHVWRRAGAAWKVALALESPLPKRR